MNTNEKWNYIVELDDKLLTGGVMHSEWSSIMVREADTAFANGAHLAAVYKLLNLGRHLVSAENYRYFRRRAFSSWENALAL